MKDVTLEHQLGSTYPRAFVFMQRKTLCSRLVESVSEKARSSTAIRQYTYLLIKTNTDCLRRCPCLTCSIKITQVGITEVVYSQVYGMDEQVHRHHQVHLLDAVDD